MALLFPNSPTLNQLFSAGDVLYKYDGEKWVAVIDPPVLGTAAEYDVATSGASVPLLNGTNTWSATQTVDADLVINGTGRKIKADMSSGFGSRLEFQSTTTNGATGVWAVPNGTSTSGSLAAFNSSDVANSAYAALTAGAAQVSIGSFKEGTGSDLPVGIYSGGVQRMEFLAAGGISVTHGSSTNFPIEITSSGVGNGRLVRFSHSDAGQLAGIRFECGTAYMNIQAVGQSYTAVPLWTNRSVIDANDGNGLVLSSRLSQPIIFAVNRAENARFDTSGHLVPGTTNTFDLGSSSLRWRNIYTQDLHLSNGIGDYTVVEGEENLYLVNHKTGKSFKFALIEVPADEVPPMSARTE